MVSDAKQAVWLSAVMTDPSLNKYAVPDVFEDDAEIALDTITRNLRGEKLAPEKFPTEAYAKYPDKKIKSLPDICSLWGFWTFSSACAEVFSNFDLGATKLHPIKIFEHDRSTPISGEYFTINFAETKSSFLPEESRVRKSDPDNPDSNIWLPCYDMEKEDIAVDASALSGSDLWIDARFLNGFFMSDRLVRALKVAKLTRRFNLHRCRTLMHDLCQAP